MGEQIDSVKADINKFKEEGVQYQTERQNILKGLEGSLEGTTKEADLFGKQLRATDKILDQLKAGIDSVFGKINCDRSTISEMLGDNDSVNENNMMQYLGIIEQKTNELLQIHAYLQLKELANQPEGTAPATSPTLTAAALLGGPAAPPSIAPVQIVPPSTEDDRDFDGPLNQNELKLRVMRTVAKKEQSAPLVPAGGAPGKRADKAEKTPRGGDRKKK